MVSCTYQIVYFFLFVFVSQFPQTNVTFIQVSAFLRKQLKLKNNDPLVRTYIYLHVSQNLTQTRLSLSILQFTYINSSFCPSPDQLVGTLFEVCIQSILLLYTRFCRNRTQIHTHTHTHTYIYICNSAFKSTTSS